MHNSQRVAFRNASIQLFRSAITLSDPGALGWASRGASYKKKNGNQGEDEGVVRWSSRV